jgi:hypothetical protein
MATALDKIDPAAAWQPAAKQDWNLKWAAHLYRRAGFGVPPAGTVGGETSWQTLQEAVQQGMEPCVEQLLTGGPGQEDFNDLLDAMGRRIAASAAGSDVEKLQGWWLYRMLYTPHPLLERTTLFWHDHFATSVAKVGKPPLMYQQNTLLRRHALGHFPALLLEISRNPAMIVWLDSNKNVKGAPNENYARELMELFSLGIGNYTEQDIREAARAFTGWNYTGDQYVFNAAQHDDEPKTVFGQTGQFNGDDIVGLVLDQPAAAKFIVRKLYGEFISESQPPPDALIEPLAEQLRKSDYDIAACLRTMLRSQLFYSEHAYRQRIKSPVEYVIGLLKTFDARVPVEQLAAAMDGLGQSLFAPPNVKGWDGGKAWLNSATLLARHNLAWRLIGGQDNNFAEMLDPAALVRQHATDAPADQAEFLLNLLLQGDVNNQAREQLTSYAQSEKPAAGKKKKTKKARQSEVPAAVQLRELAHTILLMPEYQLA